MRALAFALLLPAAVFCQTNPIVRFDTNLGNIDVELYPADAPKTVANFLSYVNKGAYTNSIIHRSVARPTPFVIQGGGYRLNTNSVDPIPSDPAVVNEFKIPNTRGTIAMAKQEGNPNSATNQWFFNLADNTGNLDVQNGGFTVFGKILNDSSLVIMDRIAAVPTYQSPYADTTPLLNYRPGQVVGPANFVTIRSIRPLARAISAGAFGAFGEAAPGSYLEIYGVDLAATTRSWEARDFNNGAAPTSLDDVKVTIGGQDAFISYISPTQVNVQVPENVAPGATVPVVVSYQGQEKAFGSITIKPVAAGLLAPESFKVGDYQFVVAQHQDRSLVGIPAIPNVPDAPAKAGETLTFYGVGFGAVDSGPVGGRLAQGLPRVVAPVQFFFGDREARVDYAGLVPGLVGLYQFNVVVPSGLGSQDLPLRVTVGGANLTQTLYIPVRE
ncbi:MAG TPA: peptidylprolyl isomerase [Bryobacteraceae bacterium]|nr:peptidylprolyl isomerase [Bryobacteraceae bacterium]